jgi:hypothetical protein
MKEKIANSIARHQMAINELKEIKFKIEDAVEDTTKFIVETQQLTWASAFTRKDKMNISIYTMNLIIDKAIETERERINKLIDAEIENEILRRNNNGN